MLRNVLAMSLTLAIAGNAFAQERRPIHVMIVTGDHTGNWKDSSETLEGILSEANMKVDVTATPSKDLTPANLANYDVLLLNYRDTQNGPADSKWTDDNKKALADAVRGGKGLVVHGLASAAFSSGGSFDSEYDKMIGGGFRSKNSRIAKAPFYRVLVRESGHPLTSDFPGAFTRENDDLCQSPKVGTPSFQVLATAYLVNKREPRRIDKEEPLVWVGHYGKGRVVNEQMGFSPGAMQDEGFRTILIRGVEWAATGKSTTKTPENLKQSIAG